MTKVDANSPGAHAKQQPKRWTRRRFLRTLAGGGLGLGVLGAGYSLVEARWLKVTRVDIPIPRLPDVFAGTTVALLADIHHGLHISLDKVRQVVRLTNALRPDIVALCGDYVYHGKKFIRPSCLALGELEAPLGVYAVLGNHDRWDGAEETWRAFGETHVQNLTNTGVWLKEGDARLRVAGVGDLWTEEQDLGLALGDTRPDETCLLLCHNPDYTEQILDPRVGLVLSGHTHGGQVQLPVVGAPITPSRCGQKYLQGLVRTPYTQVYISRGVGTIWPPVRFYCRPEIVLIRLTQGSDFSSSLQTSART
jgi:predicted MPP superfamily phosphohydrolase